MESPAWALKASYRNPKPFDQALADTIRSNQSSTDALDIRSSNRAEGKGSVQWEHSEFQGVGIETFPAGSWVVNYVGQFHQGSWHGCGTCVYSNGTVYAGEWLLGKHHGLGRMVCTYPPPPSSLPK